MNLFDWFNSLTSKKDKQYEEIIKQLNKIQMTTDEAVAQLDAIKTDLAEGDAEIRAELVKLNTRITELEELIRNGAVPDVIAAKIAEIKGSSKAIADIVPNTP